VPAGSVQAKALHALAERIETAPILEQELEVTLNFHPDHILASGESLLEALLREDLWKSQFETGSSNGGLSAYPGGERWQWEHRAFSGCYDHVPPSERPKYAALNFLKRPWGASPRFGSACFHLRCEVLERCSFCYPDSYFSPEHFAVQQRVGPLIRLAETDTCDELDRYIEAHIHGTLSLSRDVERLSLDPAFRGSEIEEQARRLPVKLDWHPGFKLSTEGIESLNFYRGEEVVALGLQLAQDAYLDPSLLRHTGLQSEEQVQTMKKLWHLIARFGTAADCV